MEEEWEQFNSPLRQKSYARYSFQPSQNCSILLGDHMYVQLTRQFRISKQSNCALLRITLSNVDCLVSFEWKFIPLSVYAKEKFALFIVLEIYGIQ